MSRTITNTHTKGAYASFVVLVSSGYNDAIFLIFPRHPRMASSEINEMQEFKEHVFKRLDNQEQDTKEMKSSINQMAKSVQDLVVVIARKEEREDAHNKEHNRLEHRLELCEKTGERCNELDKRLQAAEMRVADNHQFIDKYKTPLIVVSIIVLAAIGGLGKQALALLQ